MLILNSFFPPSLLCPFDNLEFVLYVYESISVCALTEYLFKLLTILSCLNDEDTLVVKAYRNCMYAV